MFKKKRLHQESGVWRYGGLIVLGLAGITESGVRSLPVIWQSISAISLSNMLPAGQNLFILNIAQAGYVCRSRIFITIKIDENSPWRSKYITGASFDVNGGLVWHVIM